MRDSVTRRLILESPYDFVYPKVGMNEILRHKALIKEKSGLSEDGFKAVFGILLDYVELIPDKDLKSDMKEAKDIMGGIDEKDVVFVACALAMGNCSIWSDDKDFKRQRRVQVRTTREMADEL
ncbi:MAG: PIN domain-containing protein [Candidatus Hydrothermarchaeaceae archaeon]